MLRIRHPETTRPARTPALRNQIPHTVIALPVIRIQHRLHRRGFDEPRVRRAIIPAAGSEADGSREVREEVFEVVVEGVAADFEQGRHVHLGGARVVGHEGVELGVFEGCYDSALGGGRVDFGVQGARDSEADALFADAVGSDYDEEAAAGFGAGGGGEDLLGGFGGAFEFEVV